MNNLRLTVFDIFSYTVPGICYIILTFFAVHDLDFQFFLKIMMGLSASTIFVYGLFSYLIGFTMDTIAGGMMKAIDYCLGYFNDRIIKEYKLKNTNCSKDVYHFSEIYSYIDLKSPETREKIDQYSAMSGLARNLSLAFFVFIGINIGYAAFFLKDIAWTMLIVKCVGGFSIAITLMLKAYMFRKWSHFHLLHVFHLIQDEGKKQK